MKLIDTENQFSDFRENSHKNPHIFPLVFFSLWTLKFHFIAKRSGQIKNVERNHNWKKRMNSHPLIGSCAFLSKLFLLQIFLRKIYANFFFSTTCLVFSNCSLDYVWVQMRIQLLFDGIHDLIITTTTET